MSGSRHVDFVHLHVHTSYSLLDGACRIPDLTELAVELRFPALAITDHGAMFGAVEFYRTARKAGLKPIIGQEFYVAPGSRHDRKLDGNGESSYHLVLLARDLEGYRNLLRLSSASHLEGFYYKPRIDKELLAANAGGLVAMSACLKGEVSYLLLRGDREGARAAASCYRDLFGEHFFLEVQQNGLPDQARANGGLVELSADLGIPLVATNDVHYLRREDRRMHDVLLCIQTGKTMSDPGRFRMESEELYLKSAEEMAHQFRDIPRALTATVEIAERCNLEIPLGKVHLPRFPVPDGTSTESYLDATARAGFEERMEKVLAVTPPEAREPVREEYQARLGRELTIVTEMGFAGYFLIVADFIRFARSQGIPVGPGRGSAAGSLVAYSLGITDLDPIPYNLLFERFLNPDRLSMPDIDVDFCMDRRDEVLRYVSSKYGSDRVAQIITFGTMAARGSIRDVGRVLDMSYADVDRIAKLVPEVPGITLEKALAQEPRLKEAQKEPRIADLLDLAQRIEGLHRHASTHAAGVVISDAPLVCHVPLFRGKKEEVLTQYAMGDLEATGLVKFDFLGLRTLTLLHDALGQVNRHLRQDDRPPLDLDAQPLDDAATYELLSSGATDGVFQLESSGMKDLLVKMRPGTFEDLVALVALYRPGPLGSGMVTDFINRKKGISPISYDLPQLEPILRDTYGVIVYQEQVMRIAGDVAGFSMGEADNLRRSMSKKDREKMEKLKPLFVEGARRKGTSEAKARRLFEMMENFAEYGFNKSHSAAYALISYRTAFLKAHYPRQFMAALLTSEMDNTDKVTGHIGVCRDMGIQVLPPDINESETPFTVVGDRVRFGLGAVKNVGLAALEEILGQRREGGPYRCLEDFCQRIDLRKVNRRVIESLIKAGAFDGCPGHRAQQLAALDEAMERGQRAQRDRANGQMAMFGGLAPDPASAPMPEVPAWDEHMRLSFEKESLGFYITGHPLDKYRHEIERYVTTDLGRLEELQGGQEVKVAGVRQALKEHTDRRGNRMAYLTLEDLHGSVEVTVFSEVYKASAAALAGDEPVIVHGTVEASGEKPKVLATRIEPLSGYRRRVTSQVTVSLSTIGLSREDLSGLRSILDRHQGECAVRLRLSIPARAEAFIRAAPTLRVESSDDLVREIESRFGSGTVTFD